MALDDVVIGLKRVDVGAEREAGDGVDGIAHQVGLQVDHSAGSGLRGASGPPGGRTTVFSEGKNALTCPGSSAAMTMRRCRFQTSSLAKKSPSSKPISRAIIAVVRRPPEALRPVAQHRADHGVIADEQEVAGADTNTDERTVGADPLGELLVHPRLLELESVTEERHATRAGNVFVAARLRSHALRVQLVADQHATELARPAPIS